MWDQLVLKEQQEISECLMLLLFQFVILLFFNRGVQGNVGPKGDHVII